MEEVAWLKQLKGFIRNIFGKKVNISACRINLPIIKKIIVP